MSKLIKSLPVLGLAALFFSCGGGSDIDGTWRSPCTNTGSAPYVEQVSFSGGTYTNVITIYSDNACATAYGYLTTTASYSTIGSFTGSSTGVEGLNYTITGVTFTPVTTQAASTMNGECNNATWTVGTGVNCAGYTVNINGASSAEPPVSTPYYSAYIIVSTTSPNSLYIQDSTSAASRPTTVTETVAFTKQ